MTTETGNVINAHTIWKRGLYMLLFLLCMWLAKFVTYIVVVFQFIAVLVTGSANPRLLTFGQSLSCYVFQVMKFVTFNTETHPYPLAEWPDMNADNPEDQ